MTRTHTMSAGKLRSRVWSRESVAEHAINRAVHRLFRRYEDLQLPFIPAILLRDAQRGLLTEFQRRHVEYPPLRPDMLRTVWCRVFDEQGRPMSRHGRPFTTRLFLEVAECTHKRGIVWGVRQQAMWLFIAWDDEGASVQRTRCRSRKAALALYNTPAERIGAPYNRDMGSLLWLPAARQPAPSATPRCDAHQEVPHA